MAIAHQIRDLITQTTSGTVRSRVPREMRDEVCRYAARRRSEETAWAVIARETGLYALVVSELNADPLSGDLFLFTNRRRNRVTLCSTPSDPGQAQGLGVL
jgi:hypothetical protein